MSIFKKPNELQVNSTVKMLIYGQPGIGKSTLALSAPSPVLLDFDGGVSRVNKAFQCDTLQVQSWDEVIQAMEELKGNTPYKTIVIDTAGKMLDYMAAYIIKNNSKMKKYDGSLSLQGYGARKQMFIDFVNKCSMMGKHLIFIAHEKEDKDGDTRIVRPDMSGSSLGDLIKELDLVGYMQAVGNERSIFWTPEERFYAKNTCALPQWQKIPVVVGKDGAVSGRNEFLTEVFNSYHNYLEQQATIGNSYNDLMAQVTEEVNGIDGAESANLVVERVLGYEHIWDSKARAGKMIAAKCAELGLKLNTATKKYELQSA